MKLVTYTNGLLNNSVILTVANLIPKICMHNGVLIFANKVIASPNTFGKIHSDKYIITAIPIAIVP